MKRSMNKAVVILMTAALLFSSLVNTGCSSSKKDIEEIEELSEEFIGEFGKGDSKVIGEMVDGTFHYMDGDRDQVEVLLALASRTEILEYKGIEVDRKDKKAKARLRISYADVYDFVNSTGASCMSKDEYIKAAESYDDLTTGNLTLNFVFDESEGRWLIKESSARKYKELFNSGYFFNIASISAEEADKIFNEVLERFASGEFELPYYSLDVYDMRVFDEGEYDSPVIKEALEEFTKAYFKYIVDHGYSFDRVSDYIPYEIVLHGWAPSKYDMLDYISSDECIIKMYEVTYRSQAVFYSDRSIEDDICEAIAGIYRGLTERIPDMEPLAINWYLSVDPELDSPELGFNESFLPVSDTELYSARLLSDEQDLRCQRKAIENLYAAGEISEEKYKAYIEQLENFYNPEQSQIPYAKPGSERSINWEGTENTENQAVAVIEYVPDWSDGTLIYGISSMDSNGLWMHYSKEVGWEDTAGYHYEDGDLTIMARFDHKFDKGTNLIYDWYINEENYGESHPFTVDEDGTDEFEFTFEDVPLPKYGTVSLRLWEEDHSHVIAYVQIYC